MTTTPLPGSDPGDRVPVYVLAGGKSRRFGSDKARALQRGVPMVSAVTELLRPIATSVTVVAATAGAYDDLGLRTIGDVVSGRGPVGGLLSAIDDCTTSGWLFLSACDWVGARVDWAQRLMQGRAQSNASAIAFRTDRWEPLFALYNTSIRGVVERRAGSQELSMQALLNEIDAVALNAPDDWATARNLNRPTSTS